MSQLKLGYYFNKTKFSLLKVPLSELHFASSKDLKTEGAG